MGRKETRPPEPIRPNRKRLVRNRRFKLKLKGEVQDVGLVWRLYIYLYLSVCLSGWLLVSVAMSIAYVCLSIPLVCFRARGLTVQYYA